MSEQKPTFVTSLEAARAAPSEVAFLEVNADWNDRWQTVISEFENLKHLKLFGIADIDPRGVSSLPAGLEALTVVVNTPSQLVPWTAMCPQLRELTVYGTETVAGELPDEMGAWTKLERLELLECGGTTFPAGLAAAPLHTLVLRNSSMADIPERIASLTSLRTLEIRHHIRSLPAGFAALENLETLLLRAALNEGTMDAADMAPDALTPLPDVLRELPALKTLNLDRCGIIDRDFDVLEDIETLESLSMQFSGVKDASGLDDLPALTHLNLAYAYNLDAASIGAASLTHLELERCDLGDASFLEDLPNLHTLNIEGADLKSLEPVLKHPSLAELKADDSVQARWTDRKAVSDLSPADIRAAVGSAVLEDVERGLRQMDAWVGVYSTDDENALRALFEFEGGDEEDTAEVPVLGPALETHADISTDGLVRVVRAGFQSSYDNFDAVKTALERLSTSGDASAQLEVVHVFQKACEYYDPGHRFWGDTVLDLFTDDYFPMFEPGPLAALLAELSTDALNQDGGDAMDALFAPAFKKATGETLDSLCSTLSAYAENAAQYMGVDYFAALITEATEAHGRKLAALESSLERLRATEAWQERLEEEPAAVSALIDAWTDGSLSQGQKDTLEDAAQAALEMTCADSAAMRARALKLAAHTERVRWLPGDTWKTMLLEGELEGADGAWLLEHIARKVNRGVAMDDAVLEAYAAAAGTTMDEIHGVRAATALQKARRPAQYLSALDAVKAHPTTFELGQRWVTWLAHGYDQLRVAEAYDKVFEISDKLLSMRDLLPLTAKQAQYALSYPLVCALKLNDGSFEKHVQPWLDGVELEEPRFAFNLACYHAQMGDADALFPVIARARALGKPAAQFLEDADFEAYLDDPGFKAALAAD